MSFPNAGGLDEVIILYCRFNTVIDVSVMVGPIQDEAGRLKPYLQGTVGKYTLLEQSMAPTTCSSIVTSSSEGSTPSISRLWWTLMISCLPKSIHGIYPVSRSNADLVVFICQKRIRALLTTFFNCMNNGAIRLLHRAP